MVKKKGFTLIELLLVVLILAILASIVVPRITANTADAKKSKCDADWANLVVALELYAVRNMDGRAVLAKLKASKKTSGIPVIMLTAVADEDYIAAAQKSGAVDYIVKPFDYEVLLEKIAQALKSKKKYKTPVSV